MDPFIQVYSLDITGIGNKSKKVFHSREFSDLRLQTQQLKLKWTTFFKIPSWQWQIHNNTYICFNKGITEEDNFICLTTLGMLVAFSFTLIAGCSNPAQFFTWTHELTWHQSCHQPLENVYLFKGLLPKAQSDSTSYLKKKATCWVIQHKNRMQFFFIDDPGKKSPKYFSHVLCNVHKTTCGYMYLVLPAFDEFWPLFMSWWLEGLQEAATTLETVKTAAGRLLLRS